AAMPTPTQSHHGSGVAARIAISAAPARATSGAVSMPITTHDAATVDREMTMTRRNTIPADHRADPGTSARARSHRVSTGGRSSDAYCISRPHQAGEVVALAHHVQIDVLPAVEARVAVRAAEARRVYVEHGRRRAAPADGLQKPHPVGARARRYDGDGAPRQPAH